jgi:hypothetical protein
MFHIHLFQGYYPKESILRTYNAISNINIMNKSVLYNQYKFDIIEV